MENFEIDKSILIPKKGDVYRLHKSKKNGKMVAFTFYGKVIIIKNYRKLHYGFAKIVDVVDKGNCFVATMENVPYDFYYERWGADDELVIPYDELQEVLKIHGYTHQYTEQIDEDNFFYAWANLDTGSIITIETWNRYGRRTYNSVNLYIVTHSSLCFDRHYKSGFSHGSTKVCCFNLMNCEFSYPITNLTWYNNPNTKDWGRSIPSLWHYGYGDDVDHIKAARTLYKFKDADEIIKSFNIDIKGFVERTKEFWKGSDKYKEYENEGNID